MGSKKRSARAKQIAEFKSQLGSDMDTIFEREEKRQARVRHYHAVGIAAIIFDWIDKRCEDPLTDVVDFLIETQRSSPLRLKRT